MITAAEIAIEDIKKHEGFRQFPYRDTVGKLTIGYGFNLDDVGLSVEESELILADRVAAISADLAATYDYYPSLPKEAKAVLIDMQYNLGKVGLSKFKRMHEAFRDGAYLHAATEMLDSRWAVQVGRRATNLAAIISSVE